MSGRISLAMVPTAFLCLLSSVVAFCHGWWVPATYWMAGAYGSLAVFYATLWWRGRKS